MAVSDSGMSDEARPSGLQIPSRLSLDMYLGDEEELQEDKEDALVVGCIAYGSGSGSVADGSSIEASDNSESSAVLHDPRRVSFLHLKDSPVDLAAESEAGSTENDSESSGVTISRSRQPYGTTQHRATPHHTTPHHTTPHHTIPHHTTMHRFQVYPIRYGTCPSLTLPALQYRFRGTAGVA